MIHHVALMGLLVLTHIVCFAVMTERKYTVGKTLAYYAGFAAWFIGWTLLISAWIGANSPCTAPAMFCGTIVAGFAVFMLTSADALCKKLFLFINYSSVFCILYCLSVLIGDALFPALSGNRLFYARNITCTLLYIPTVLLYLRFVRPRVRTVPARKKRTWLSISLVSLLFLAAFASFVVLFYPTGSHTGGNVFLFAVVVLIYGSVLWVVFETIRYMSEENRMELVAKNMEYLQGQLALARKNERILRTVRHDFRHHSRNIMTLLQKGDVQEALRYIRQYEENLEASGKASFCPHATVNAVLGSFCAQAQKEGFRVSARGHAAGIARGRH